MRQMALALLPIAMRKASSGNDYAHNRRSSTTINFGPNWVIRILPFMEYNDLYNQFDLTKYISDPNSTKNIATKGAIAKHDALPVR